MRNQLLKRLGLNSRCASRTGQRLSFPAVTVKSLFIRSAACRKHEFIGHISLSGSGFKRNRVDLNRRRSQRNLCDRDSSFSLTDTFLRKGKQGLIPPSLSRSARCEPTWNWWQIEDGSHLLMSCDCHQWSSRSVTVDLDGSELLRLSSPSYINVLKCCRESSSGPAVSQVSRYQHTCSSHSYVWRLNILLALRLSHCSSQYLIGNKEDVRLS